MDEAAVCLDTDEFRYAEKLGEILHVMNLLADASYETAEQAVLAHSLYSSMVIQSFLLCQYYSPEDFDAVLDFMANAPSEILIQNKILQALDLRSLSGDLDYQKTTMEYNKEIMRIRTDRGDSFAGMWLDQEIMIEGMLTADSEKIRGWLDILEERISMGSEYY